MHATTSDRSTRFGHASGREQSDIDELAYVWIIGRHWNSECNASAGSAGQNNLESPGYRCMTSLGTRLAFEHAITPSGIVGFEVRHRFFVNALSIVNLSRRF